MNEKEKVEISAELNHMLMEMYDKGIADAEIAAMKAIEAAVLAEREACAKLMDDMAARDNMTNYYKVAANAIRARSNQ